MDEDKLSTKDIPSYHWATKEEGKTQYPKFVKDFQGTLKGLRFVVESGGIDRYLGTAPGPRPASSAERGEWLARFNHYQTKQEKVEMYCATALGALEKSFPYGTTPRNIIDKAAEKPEATALSNWTYRSRFEACWNALKDEYQPSTSVDLRQLRDQISKLDDQGPGGFEAFQSEFHRLHAEILATGVAEAMTERELNEIVRDGIKNPFIWVNVCYPIYKDSDKAPWRDTFTAVATALTSFRQKGFDPYAEAKSGPTIGTNVVSANSANAFSPNQGQSNKKRSANYPRDNSGKFQKQAKTYSTPSPGTPASDVNVNSNFNPPSGTPSPDGTPRKCTRCWRPNSHSYKVCAELKCSCGSWLKPGQLVCINYDSHSPEMKFLKKMPHFIETALQNLKNSKPLQPKRPTPTPPKRNPPRAARSVSVMSAQSFEDAHSAPSSGAVDEWD